MGHKNLLGKKGGLGDIIFLIVAMFLIGIVFLSMWKVMKVIDDDFQSNSEISDEGKKLTSKIRDKYVSITDSAFLMLFVGLAIAIAVGAWFIRTHPALFWFTIPILGFLIFLGAIFSNFWWNFSNSGDFVTELSDFLIIPFILNNFVYFLVGIVILVAILLFAKNQNITV